MKIFLRSLAGAALLVMLVPVGLFCAGRMEHEAVKSALTGGTLLWFAAVLPLRFRRGTEP